MALDTFGKRLRVLRMDRGLSQIDLRDKMEKECGVSIGY
jgi:transcriptional regulator with XRE-family HTH domain